MKRKVTKMGPASLVVSLPSKWVQSNKLKKGDTIELTIEKRKLIIEPEVHEPTEKKIEIEAKKVELILERYLGILYKKGYDEIAVRISNTKQKERIIKYIPSLIGFEIVEQKEGTIKIRNIAKDSPQEYDAVLKRIFYLLFTFTEDLLEALKKSDSEQIKSTIYHEQINNKLTDYCKRLIYKYEPKENSAMHYAIVKTLEDIADEYKYIALTYTKENRFNQNLTPLFQNVSEYIRELQEIYYKKDIQLISEFAKKRKKLLAELQKALEKAKYPESQTISNLTNIVQKTFDLNVPIATIITE